MDGKNHSQGAEPGPNQEHLLSPEKGDQAACGQLDFRITLTGDCSIPLILPLYKLECLMYPFPVSLLI